MDLITRQKVSIKLERTIFPWCFDLRLGVYFNWGDSDYYGGRVCFELALLLFVVEVEISYGDWVNY